MIESESMFMQYGTEIHDDGSVFQVAGNYCSQLYIHTYMQVDGVPGGNNIQGLLLVVTEV